MGGERYCIHTYRTLYPLPALRTSHIKRQSRAVDRPLTLDTYTPHCLPSKFLPLVKLPCMVSWKHGPARKYVPPRKDQDLGATEAEFRPNYRQAA
jgi:hypothetical protein